LYSFKWISIGLISIGLLVYAGYQLFTERPFSAIASVFSVALLVWSALLGDIRDSCDNSLSRILGGVIAFFCVLQAFYGSHLFNLETSRLNFDLFSKSLTVNSCSPTVQPLEDKRNAFYKLKDVMSEMCVTQNTRDAIFLGTDLVKALRLDPVTGMLDSIYGDLSKKENVTCIDMAVQLNQLCPGTFKTDK
jgi:hypothetical protein